LTLKVKRRIAYFHGVTKPELLQVFDPGLSVICSKAIAQMKRLQEFDCLAANSKASADALISTFDDEGRWSADDLHIIPPRLLNVIPPADEMIAPKQKHTKLLYVGRIKSHKKIEHILELFSAFRALDKEAELDIVGGCTDKAYADYLMWVQSVRLKLPSDKVHWMGSVDEDVLLCHYKQASVYISMSEDEGYGLPVFEAMMAGVPVAAFGLPAIREVLEDNGICFLEKDFSYLAEEIHELLHDKERLKAIRAHQRKRAQDIAREMDGAGFLKLLSAVI
jgi:glycosyltransferase involved in cell wall biosynthesis